jgi:hypothetical protein
MRKRQDLTPDPRRNIHAGLSSNCDRTGFDGMVELTMTSFLPYLLPTIQLNHSDKIFNFHAESLAQSLSDGQKDDVWGDNKTALEWFTRQGNRTKENSPSFRQQIWGQVLLFACRCCFKIRLTRE